MIALRRGPGKKSALRKFLVGSNESLFSRDFHFRTRLPVSIQPVAILRSCELHFPLWEPSSPRKAQWSPCHKNPKAGSPVFLAHPTNTLPILTSWPPDFAASAAPVYAVGTGNAAILATIAPKSRLVRWLSANSSQ
jgi:hypothetical protein